MEETKFVEIIVSADEGGLILETAYDLIVRADQILCALRAGNPGTAPAELSVDGDEATLTWGEMEGDYEGAEIRVAESKFPARLLFISVSEVKQWIADELARRKAESDRQSAASAQYYKSQAEQRERQTLAALKAKYES